MKFSFLTFFLSLTFIVSGQTDLMLGEWKAHLPYNLGKELAYGNGMIFYANNSGLMVMDEEDIDNPQFYSTVDGLSGVDLEKLAFDPNSGQLVISYTNSTIDLFSPEEVFTISDIKDNTSIQGSKKINDIHITSNGEFMYLGVGFGVLQYDLPNREFGFNTFTSEIVNGVVTDGGKIYAATESGCYFFDLESNLNENFFGDWTLIDSVFGIGPMYESLIVENLNNKIYLTADNKIYASSQGSTSFDSIFVFDDFLYTPTAIEPFDQGWVLALRNEDGKSKLIYFDEDDQIIHEDEDCASVVNGVIQDGLGRMWFGDDFRSYRFKDTYNGSCNKLEFPGPFASSVSEIDIKDNVVYVASGGVSDNFTFIANKDGFYQLKENEWTIYNQRTESLISDENLSSFFKVIAHPIKDLVYCGTYWGGMLELNTEEDELNIYTKDNTPINGLNGTVGDEDRTRIAGMAYDDDNNLWLANFGAEKPLVVLTDAGNWHNFEVNSNTNISNLVVDDLGFVWCVVNGNNGGILIYDVGERIEDPSDDRQRFIRNTELPGDGVSALTLEVDISGDVWVGTSKGAMVFECGSIALDAELCSANHPQVEQDGIGALLLATEVVQCIMIDGGNRKWFGTKNGIFVQSENAETQIAKFDTDNTPLFSNDIVDLAYNDNTGEVYVGTSKGLMTYRSQSSGAKRTHSGTVYAFPNPVYPEHDGPIAIKGLARNANVKITDLNGRLVYQTTAIGGQAIWNGTHYDSSSKAAAGVYLVFSSTTDVFQDPDTFVTKILLVR